MKTVPLKNSVSKSAEHVKKSLEEKGFIIFCDIDHQKNADTVNMDLAESRLLIFGNPSAGTKLMQTDIMMSYDLPLRLAIVQKEGQTVLLHETSVDFSQRYQLMNHPVLQNIDALFTTIAAELS